MGTKPKQINSNPSLLYYTLPRKICEMTIEKTTKKELKCVKMSVMLLRLGS